MAKKQLNKNNKEAAMKAGSAALQIAARKTKNPYVIGGAAAAKAMTTKGGLGKKAGAAIKSLRRSVAGTGKDDAQDAKEMADTASDMKEAADAASEAKEAAADVKDAKDAASDAKDVAESAGDAKEAKNASKDLIEDKDKTDDKKDKDDDKDKDKEDKKANDAKDPDPLKNDNKNNNNLIESDDDGTKPVGNKKNESLGQKMAKGAAINAGVAAAKHVAMAAALKMAMAKLLAFLSAAVQAVTSAVAAFFSAIWSGIVHAATFIANVFVSLWATSAILAIAIAASPILVVGGGTYAVVKTVQDNQYRQVDSEDDNCDEIIKDNTTDAGTTADMSAQKEENAKKSYAVFHAFGLDDDKIAGMLGNMEFEAGGFDPTSTEGDFMSSAAYDGDFVFGPNKKKFFYKGGSPTTISNLNWSEMDSWMDSTYFPACSIANPAGYRLDNGHYMMGIGLFGFTAGNGYNLMKLAESENMDWWDMDLQLEYIIRGSNNGGYGNLEGFKSITVSNPNDAADCVASSFVCKQYPWGSRGKAEPRQWSSGGRTRGSVAEEYRTQIVNWKNDSTYGAAYAQSIIARAQITLSDASTGIGAANAKKDCTDKLSFDNSSIAAAAASFAWDNESQSYNNGTPLYQKVNKAVIGDGLYRSCDRVACSAVRWSGSDDNFPEGAVPNQISYCSTSDKWKKVTWSKLSDLQPGDILFNNKAEDKSSAGHIMVYVGKDEILAKHPSVDGNLVEGSYDTQSAHCDKLPEDLTPSSPGYHGGGYTAYRNVKRETDSKYVNAVAGYSFSNTSMTGVFWPTPGCNVITERFGAHRDWDACSSTHNAVDIGCGYGAEVHAAHSGTVIEANHGYNNGWGNSVVIDHGDGNVTRYSHLSFIEVSEGATVSGNQLIGLSGNTGYSFGAHLDFKWIQNGESIDPLQFYPSITFTFAD